MTRLLFLLAALSLSFADARAQGFASPNVRPDEMTDAEQKIERELATDAVGMLKRLEGKVFIYTSLAAFEDGGELARVPYESFIEELEEVAPKLRRTIEKLPRGAMREEIRKATQSYLDGAWWWSKVRRTDVVRVTNNSFAEPRTASARPVAMSAARYTVVLYWRQARDFTRRVESAIKK